MSIRLSDEKAAERPEIGTPLAAVETCVSLIAGMFSQSESVVAYCLDLYYQTRRRYEQAEGEEDPVLIRAEDLLPALRRLWLEVLSATEPKPPAVGAAELERIELNEKPPEPEPPKPAPDPKPEPKPAPKPKPAPPAKSPPKPEPETPAKPQPDQAPKYAAEAAKLKREVCARLDELRKKGLTLARIREAANGNINDDQIMAILERKPQPVAAYRVLAAALDHIEGTTPTAGLD